MKVNILSLDFLREWLTNHFPDVRVWIPMPSVEAYDGKKIAILDIFYGQLQVVVGKWTLRYVILLIEEQELTQDRCGKLKLVQKVRVEIGKAYPQIHEVYDNTGIFEGYKVELPKENPVLSICIEARNEHLYSISVGPNNPEYGWVFDALRWFDSLARIYMRSLGLQFEAT